MASAGLGSASSQVSGLVLAAGEIQRAAAATLASMSRHAASTLADDVRIEAVALSAGMASAAGLSGPRSLPGEPA